MPIPGVDSNARAAMQSKVRGVAYLIEMQFLNSTLTAPEFVYVSTWPQNQVIDGINWIGVGNLVQVSAISESEDPTTEKLTVSVTIVNNAMKALAMGQVERYRNKRIRVYLQMFNDVYRPVGAKILRWQGFMDRVKIPRQRQGSDRTGVTSRGRIEMECSRAGLARSRNAEGLRMTASQQKAVYPGDLGLDYINELIENPTLWLSKRFQQI